MTATDREEQIPPAAAAEPADVAAFFDTAPVFRTLPAAVVGALAAGADTVRYPAGTVVLHQGGPPSAWLYVIRSGAARIEGADPARRAGGEAQVVEIASEGDVFGAASALDATAGARARFTVRAIEDLVCHRIPAARVRQLARDFPVLAEVLEHRNGRLLRRATAAAAAEGGVLRLGALAAPVGELLRREAVTVPPAASIAEAARRMTEAGVGSIPVVDDDGRPLGILTDTDLRREVVAGGHPAEAPVTTLAARPVVTIGAAAPALEALQRMAEHGISHLVAVDDTGRVSGVLGMRDLMLAEANSPAAVLREVESATDLEQLARARARMTGMLEAMVRTGIEPQRATRVITALNDRATRRALGWAEAAVTAELGALSPPRYCWLALGSEGREEQTLATDQDNALIYAEGTDAAGLRWLERFAERANHDLDRLGFPLCRGGVMANNAFWRRSLGGWREQVARWTAEASEQALMEAAIFFDFRPLYGDAALAVSLRAAVFDAVRRDAIFLAHLTRAALRTRPPLGLLRTFVVERGGEHRDTLDLKERGMAPLVDAARVLALRHGIAATNTFERLGAAADARAISAELAEDAREAYGFLMLVRLQHHLARIAEGGELDNRVNPRELPALQRRSLQVAFQVVQAVQSALSDRLGGLPAG